MAIRHIAYEVEPTLGGEGTPTTAKAAPCPIPTHMAIHGDRGGKVVSEAAETTGGKNSKNTTDN
jgi:hypothetical protein